MNVPEYPYVFELNAGESHQVHVPKKGTKLVRTIKLISVTPYFEPNYWLPDSVAKHYQKAEVVIDVSGKKTTLIHRPYQMPIEFNGLRLFVEAIKEWAGDSEVADMKDVEKDVRLSVRAAGESWGPESMIFPIKNYRWKSAVYQNTWSSLVPYNLRYYHRGEDYGAIPDRLDVVAPFSGKVIISPLPEGDGKSNAVFIQNSDGIVCRISHMNIESISNNCTVGNNVEKGEIIAKTGMTWSGRRSQTHDPHCHVELQYNNSIIASYPYLMEAYLRTFPDKVIAVAGGYQFTVPGNKVVLDGTRSLIKKGEKITSYKWKLHNGATAKGPVLELAYDKPGLYTEELEVRTKSGEVDRDFVQVRVYNSVRRRDLSYGWAYHFPLRDIKAEEPVLFWNRLINTKSAVLIDFGDGTRKKVIGKELSYSFQKRGRYVVTLSSTGPEDEPVTIKMEVVVDR
jgi:murein DD-endopeptidase MepM/ murein hydrolase activator NlpD